MNLDDALFCASCGVALSREHLHHPGLAALVGDETDANREMRQPTDTPPTAGTAAVPTPAAAVPPTTTAATTSFTPAGSAPVGPPPSTGTPGMVDPTPRPWVLPTVLVGIVVVLAAIVVVVLATRSGDDSTASSNVPVTEPPVTEVVPTSAAPTDPSVTTQPSDTTTPETTTPATSAPATTTAPTSPPDAAAQLVELADDDLPRALALRERWVPQLSAKQDGTVWEGVTYDLTRILALHQTLSDQVGGALLVEGSSLAFLSDGQRMAGWWFTLADVDFDDPDSALQWCEDEGFTRENCAARLVTDRDDATGTLRLRPESPE